MRKISKGNLKKKLDKVVTQILLKQGSQCVVCGSKTQLGCGHIFSRTHLATRWDITPDGNCHLQCWPCNYKHVHNQYPYNMWYVHKFNQDKFDELYQRWNSPCPMKQWQIQAKYEELKDLLDTIKVLS